MVIFVILNQAHYNYGTICSSGTGMRTDGYYWRFHKHKRKESQKEKQLQVVLPVC